MNDKIDAVCKTIAGLFPYSGFRDPSLSFLHRAFVTVLLIGPLCSTVGIQVVNFRFAFFAEAVGHSAFTGIALGFLLTTLPGMSDLDPTVTMTAVGVVVALAITLYRRGSSLPSDTVIGVFSSFVVALGLTIITHLMKTTTMRTNLNGFLMGNVLTITSGEVLGLAVFFIVAMAFQAFAYNRLLLIGLNADLAQTFRIRVAAYEYAFSILLALVVMFAIKTVGVLLVTAMLVIPAAAARNFAKSAGAVFWWGIVISWTSGIAGLILSDQYNTATGSTTILVSTVWFALSSLIAWLDQR